MADKFYVHSEEFWGYPSRRWAVFERTEAWPGKWKRRSRFFLTSREAEKLRDRMLADWSRYERAIAVRDAEALTVRAVLGGEVESPNRGCNSPGGGQP